jgi:hypothetical protein
MGRPGLAGTMARTAVIAGTATAVSGSVQRSQAASADAAAQSQAREQQQQQVIAQEAAAEQAAQAAQDAQAAQAAPPPPPPAPGDDLIASLERLGALRTQGLLTDEEFVAAKAKLLG